ncbi:ArdC-like ssDNA-binding domain-containing protein, partial [Neisseria sp. P0004.S008]|uniref:ArdC-like ssDNA-binding domain-containing protein n=1 Tax=Neisseria sp. P0004.S008 TaxID=3436672 RepID=UPI003F7D3F4E
PFQLPWQPYMGRDFPFITVSGNEYSGMNRLNLMIQGYSDTRWMTYKQAQSVNAQVRNGERGTGLVRLITHTEKIQKDENGKIIR